MLIYKEIENIEKFISSNFIKFKKNLSLIKKLEGYAFYLERIKNNYNKYKENNEKEIEQIVINDILSLKKMIAENNKVS